MRNIVKVATGYCVAGSSLKYFRWLKIEIQNRTKCKQKTIKPDKF